MPVNRLGTISLTVTIILIGSAFLIFGSNPVHAQEVEDVKLYLGSSGRLSTSPPPLTPQGSLAAMGNGDEADFTLEYPLAYDLGMEGTVDSGNMVIEMHLEGFNSLTSIPKLEVELYEDPVSGSSILIAAAELDQDDLSQDVISIPFQSSQGYDADAGSTLRLVMSYSETGGLPGMTFFYISPGGETSYISFRGAVYPEDPMELKAMDSSGNPVEEVIPYGPQEAREVTFSASVRDVFGANDVSSISMIMTSSVGSVLFNTSTDDPDPEGGEPITYFNYTFEIPESTPTDTYTITATAESFTGALTEASIDLVVAPGLFLQLDDDQVGVDAGDIAQFSLNVLNGGDGTDRISFTASSESGWNIDVPSDTEIEGGRTETVEFRVYVPLRAQEDDVDTVTITAASRNADKEYSIEGSVEVLSSASYGIEPRGDVTKSVLAGQPTSYSLRVINIVNKTKEFEISAEDLPMNWDVDYSSASGELQGSLYKFEINASEEEIVTVDLEVAEDGPFGRNEFSIYVRARGETDRKYIYLITNVVDETREVVDLVSDQSRKTAVRTGSGYPVTYGKVYFSLELYNPTLQPVEFDLTVDAPADWDAEFDYDDIELQPGEGSSWNLSIIPEPGTSWQGGSPYLTDVEIDGGSLGEFSERLEVLIPKVTVISADREWETLDVTVGDTVLFNITLKNRGNHKEDIDVTLDMPAGLEMNYTQESVSISPGGIKTIRGELTIGDVEKMGTVGFQLEYTTSKGTTTLDYTLKVSEKKEGGDDPILMYVAIGAGVVIAVAAAMLIYMRFFSGKERMKKEPKEPVKEPSKKGTVSVSASPPRPTPGVRASPAVDPDVIQEADDILANILGDQTSSGGSDDGKFEVVEVRELE